MIDLWDNMQVVDRKKLEIIFEMLPIGLLVVDKNIAIHHMNQKFLQIFHIEGQSEEGKVFGEAIGCVNAISNGCGHSSRCGFCRFREIVASYIQNGRPMCEQLVSLEVASESDHVIKWYNINIISLSEEIPKEYLITLEDVTKRILYERSLEESELKLAKDRSEEANRAKSEFLANMSHEIRTPLNGIVGMIELTMMGQLTKEEKDNLKTAMDCVHGVIDIINDVLDFSKIEAGKLRIELQNFEITETIRSVMKSNSKHALEKHLGLSIEFEDITQINLVGDKNRLKQIMNNLISNAIKFTNQGDVRVKVKQRPSETSSDQIILMIEVKDSGIGIAEEKRDMLFKSFTQIDGSFTRQYGGTGLGLVISKQLVEMMGGSMGFISELGVGSIFTIQVPLKIARHIECNTEAVAERMFLDRRVLLVEDDRVNQIVVSKMLESFGIKAYLAVNGEQAVAMATQNLYDLILMDIQMPVMDGIIATKIIRDKSQASRLNQAYGTPIVAMTAFALKGDEAVFKASGMDDYISKPFNRVQMQKMLQRNIKDQEWEQVENLIAGYKNSIENPDLADVFGISDENEIDIDTKLKLLKSLYSEGNFIVLEIVAHQMKKAFEVMNVEELKNLAFKTELEIRKERYENIDELLRRIEHIWEILKSEKIMGVNNEEDSDCRR